jgi:hypothetical protein
VAGAGSKGGAVFYYYLMSFDGMGPGVMGGVVVYCLLVIHFIEHDMFLLLPCVVDV